MYDVDAYNTTENQFSLNCRFGSSNMRFLKQSHELVKNCRLEPAYCSPDEHDCRYILLSNCDIAYEEEILLANKPDEHYKETSGFPPQYTCYDTFAQEALRQFRKTIKICASLNDEFPDHKISCRDRRCMMCNVPQVVGFPQHYSVCYDDITREAHKRARERVRILTQQELNNPNTMKCREPNCVYCTQEGAKESLEMPMEMPMEYRKCIPYP